MLRPSRATLGVVAAFAFPFACGFTPQGSMGFEDEDLLLRFQRIFAPLEVPPDVRSPASVPEKCATALVREFDGRRSELPPSIERRIEEYLQPTRAVSFAHETPHFRFVYDIAGADAVPADDLAPANGVPDWIERVAAWAEFSWHTHVSARGFAPPVVGGERIEIRFREMNAYGYTERVAGSTRLVLHRNFDGFPENQDPEGDAPGAAKVTVAHELMHAIQFIMSGWTEGAWLEADATYAEDVVFDEVNDYVRFLGGSSPIGDPAGWAWTGPGYEDCLFERVLAETHGDAIIRDFFLRRGSHATESVTRSFDATLESRGSSLAAMSARLAVWSFFSGANATERPEGFEEADLFPTPPLYTHLASVPASAFAPAPGLGTRYVAASAPQAAGRPQVFISGDSNRDFAVHAITLDRQGARQVHSIPMSAGRSEIAEVAMDWSDLVLLTFAVTVVDDLPSTASSNVTLDDDLAVGVVESAAGTTLRLAPNRPNPFGTSTTISFFLPRPADAAVTVHDLAGRLVRTLVRGTGLAPGLHDAPWSGENDQGERVAPGVYTVRLVSEDAFASQKIHLLR